MKHAVGVLGTGLLVSLVMLWAGLASGGAAAQSPWHERYFPNVELTTQTGDHVRFYDLIKGKKVAIELIYTTCQFACPLETARLAQVQTLLGDRMGRDIFFYSISIDPEHDTPPVLKAFAEKYHAGPGWTFLTGKAADIELLSKKLGLYSDPNPSNQDGHIPTLLLGNEATGQWTRGSALDNPKLTAVMITHWLGGYSGAPPVRTYAAAKPLPKLDAGAYLFATKCSACHSLGNGTTVGPDLAGVTMRRSWQWLTKYLAAPDTMLNAGDPVAKALFEQYNQIPMPNLKLSGEQIQDVVGYLERIDSGKSR
jgi:protein SCO1/2